VLRFTRFPPSVTTRVGFADTSLRHLPREADKQKVQWTFRPVSGMSKPSSGGFAPRTPAKRAARSARGGRKLVDIFASSGLPCPAIRSSLLRHLPPLCADA